MACPIKDYSMQDIFISVNPHMAVWLCNPGDKNVESFIEHSQRVSLESVEIYRVPSFARPGDEKIYFHLTDSFKAVLKAIISFLCKVRDCGFSISSFDISNVVICGRKLKFRGLDFVPSETFAGFWEFCHLLRQLMENLIYDYKPSGYEIPYLFIHLLSTMRNYMDGNVFSWTQFEKLLVSHFALMSYDDSLCTIKKFGLKSAIGRDHFDLYWTALKEMERRQDYRDNWIDFFTGFKPEIGAVGDCFNYEYNGKKVVYKNTNFDILRFCGNNVVHMHQHMIKYQKRFTTMDIFLNIMAFFDEELSSFLKLAFQFRIEGHFVPDACEILEEPLEVSTRAQPSGAYEPLQESLEVSTGAQPGIHDQTAGFNVLDEFDNSFANFIDSVVDKGYIEPSVRDMILSSHNAHRQIFERGEHLESLTSQERTNLYQDIWKQVIIPPNFADEPMLQPEPAPPAPRPSESES